MHAATHLDALPALSRAAVLLVLLAASWLLAKGLGDRRLGPPRWVFVALVLASWAIPLPAILASRVLAPIGAAWNWTPWLEARPAMPKIVNPPGLQSDLVTQVVPWAKGVREAIFAGEWPAWNPDVSAGVPLAGSAQPAPLAAHTLVGLAVPFPDSFAVGIAIKLFIAMLGAWLFLRDQELSAEASLFGAVAWGLSGFQLFWVGWTLGAASAFLPLVLVRARRLAIAPSPASVVHLAVALTLCCLAGHPETTLHVVALAVLWFLFVSVRERPAGSWQVRLGAGLGAGALALALSAVYLFPVVDTLAQSAEYDSRAARSAASDHGPPGRWSWLAEQFVPAYQVAPPAEPPSRHRHSPWFNNYVGSVALALAFLGLGGARHRLRLPALALLALGLAAGAGFRPLWLLLDNLPGFALAINDRLVFAGCFAFSCLAALGCERLFRRASDGASGRRDTLRLALVVALLVAAAGVAATTTGRAVAIAAGHSPALLATDAAWYVLAPAALLLALAFRSRPRLVALLLAVLLVAQRQTETAPFFLSYPRETFFPLVPPLDTLPRRGEPYRVVGVGPGALSPNSATMAGLADIRGYNAVTLGRFRETYPLWRGSTTHLASLVDRLQPFHSFLGVRYAFWRGASKKIPGWRSIWSAGNARLLENQRALPLAFVPAALHRVTHPGTTIATLARVRDFAREAWIEAPAELAVPAANGAPDDRVRTAVAGNGRYRLAVRLASESWIVTSIPAWKGWRATVAGRRLPIAVANHAFVALRAPAGEATIDLAFRPRSLPIGGAISLAGLAAALALGVAARRGRSAGGVGSP